MLTALAMVAFAANSLLCRMALDHDLADPASFTFVRIVSGAIMLVLLVTMRDRKWNLRTPSFAAVAALFCYMIFFSFAYVTLSAATGALLLFGAVQFTMFSVGLKNGERFGPIAWLGFAAAIVGLIYLVVPGVTAPEPFGALLMIVAGVAWGIYSLIGRGATDPLHETARNFLYATLPACLTGVVFFRNLSIEVEGVILATASGAIASGVGYAIWYWVLPSLAATRAATVQLSVPVLAAIGGVLFLSEDVTMRVGVASLLTVGGIWLVLTENNRTVVKSTQS